MNMGNLNMREKKTQACLTKSSYAGCYTRWRGLESHLLWGKGVCWKGGGG